MAKGPNILRPLPTVLAALDYQYSNRILSRGSHSLRVGEWSSRARRDAISGQPDVRKALSASQFWSENDPEGKIVIFQKTSGGPLPFAAEEGSRYVPTESGTQPMLGKTAAPLMTSGRQFESKVDGTRFTVFYKRHFVKRYTHDEGNRPAVARFLTPEMIREEIEKALPQIKEMLEDDPYAQGIVISKSYGLSMKVFGIEMPDGWQLDFATMIIAMPLWRTSDREVEIAVNPVVPVHFENSIAEDLQLALLADLAPRFMELSRGEEDNMAGEIVSALVAHQEDGFHVSDASWNENWQPLDV